MPCGARRAISFFSQVFLRFGDIGGANSLGLAEDFISRHGNRCAFVVHVFVVVEKREHLKVFGVCNRVEFMGVTLRATHREAQPHRRGGVGAVNRRFVAKLFRVGAAFFVDAGVAMISRSDDLRFCGVWQ